MDEDRHVHGTRRCQITLGVHIKQDLSKRKSLPRQTVRDIQTLDGGEGCPSHCVLLRISEDGCLAAAAFALAPLADTG